MLIVFVQVYDEMRCVLMEGTLLKSNIFAFDANQQCIILHSPLT